MRSEVLVSIVLPLYNPNLRKLSDTLESIFRQTYKALEIIIVYDGVDGEAQFVIQNKVGLLLRSRPDIAVVYLDNIKNVGVCRSLARAVSVASGVYIARIDDSDIWDQAKIAKQIKCFSENPSIVVLGTRVKHVGFFSIKVIIKEYGLRLIRPERALLSGINPLVHSSVVFKKFPNFNYNFQSLFNEDFDLWLRLCELGEVSIYPEVLTFYTHDRGSVTYKNRYVMKASSLETFFTCGIVRSHFIHSNQVLERLLVSIIKRLKSAKIKSLASRYSFEAWYLLMIAIFFVLRIQKPSP